MGLSEHSSDKVDLSPGGRLLIPATEKENVTAGEDKRSLGRAVTREPYLMVRGIFTSDTLESPSLGSYWTFAGSELTSRGEILL